MFEAIAPSSSAMSRKNKVNVSNLPVFDMVNVLDDDAMISEYISQVLADGDSDELIRALGYIAKTKGIANIAKESGLDL